MFSLILFNAILHVLLKIGKLKKDTEQIGPLQFNTMAKNPMVIKDMVATFTTLMNMVAFNLSKMIVFQVPQSYDKSLGGMMLTCISFGIVTPLIYWFSNKKLQKYAYREFWDEAPLWLIQMKENIKVDSTQISTLSSIVSRRQNDEHGIEMQDMTNIEDQTQNQNDENVENH